jgi:hypothetical protein
LSFENLQYEKSYLQREIRACTDLPTPNLLEIEKELGRPLSSKVFSENLLEINTASKAALVQEQNERVDEEKHLQGVKDARKAALDRLDRKHTPYYVY